MPRPNLSALFAEFQLQHPDSPGLRLLEELVDRLEALEQRPPPLRLVKVTQESGQPGYVDPSIVTGVWASERPGRTILHVGFERRTLQGSPEEVRAQLGPVSTTEDEDPRF